MSNNERTIPQLSRRQALMRLGIAAGAIYAAPVLVNLDAAHASRGSGGGSGSGGGRGSGGRGSGGRGSGGGGRGSRGSGGGRGSRGSRGGSGSRASGGRKWRRRRASFWKPFW